MIILPETNATPATDSPKQSAGLKPVMSLAEFQTSLEFLACTEKAQRWLVALVESNLDYRAATLSVYSKTPRQAQILSYAVRKWPSVRRALNLYLGRTDKDAFLEDLQTTIRRAPEGSVARVKAMALYARMKFGVGEEPEAAASKTPVAPAAPGSSEPVRFKIGEEVTDDNGKRFIVTGISADGLEVTDAEPIE